MCAASGTYGGIVALTLGRLSLARPYRQRLERPTLAIVEHSMSCAYVDSELDITVTSVDSLGT
jgi:hypothetical protein